MDNNTHRTGTILGMPYEFRRPTAERAKSRLWNPGGALFPPKVWGVGWSLNFAHPGAWVFIAILSVLIAVF